MKPTCLFCNGLLLSSGLMLLCLTVGVSAEPPGSLTEEAVQDLGELPPGGTDTVLISPRGDRIAYVIEHDEAQTVMLDGKSLGTWDSINQLTFSRDGRHVMYFAERGGQTGIVRNNQALPLLGKIEHEVISPCGFHYSYVTRDEKFKKSYLCRDGDTSRQWDAIREVRFSECGRHLGMLVRNRRPSKPTADGDDDDNDDDASNTRTSGRQMRSFLVVDGSPGPSHDDIFSFSFSPNGQHTLCWAEDKNETVLYFDRRSVLTDPNALKKVAPVCSPNNSRLAYIRSGAGNVAVICNGRRGPLLQDQGKLVFSNNSKHLAYAAQIDGKWCMVRNNKLEGDFTEARTPVFSRRSRHMAYVAAEGNKRFVICDGKRGADYDDITWVGFSYFDKHLVYLAKRGQGWVMVCDGVEGPVHDKVWIPERYRVAPRKLTLVVADGNQVKRVNIPWPDKRTWSDGLSPLQP